jgi:hypothetical protein
MENASPKNWAFLQFSKNFPKKTITLGMGEHSPNLVTLLASHQGIMFRGIIAML